MLLPATRTLPWAGLVRTSDTSGNSRLDASGGGGGALLELSGGGGGGGSVKFGPLKFAGGGGDGGSVEFEPADRQPRRQLFEPSIEVQYRTRQRACSPSALIHDLRPR